MTPATSRHKDEGPDGCHSLRRCGPSMDIIRWLVYLDDEERQKVTLDDVIKEAQRAYGWWRENEPSLPSTSQPAS